MSTLEITFCATPDDVVKQSGVPVNRACPWDLSHLDAFAFSCDLGLGFDATVLVLFSSHCFTHSFSWDARARGDIPAGQICDDGRETRVLSAARYRASRQWLREMMITLPTRHIVVADDRRPNFMTVEITDDAGARQLYAAFFEVEKDKARKHRLVLRVQSAYTLEQGLTKRQRAAKKVSLRTILRAAFEGRKIRP